jgi:hypothetical protein
MNKEPKEPKFTKADAEYYTDRWLKAQKELDTLKNAIRTILEAVDVPYHDHDSD